MTDKKIKSILFRDFLGLHIPLRLTSLNYSRSDFLKYIWKITHLFVILHPEFIYIR